MVAQFQVLSNSRFSATDCSLSIRSHVTIDNVSVISVTCRQFSLPRVSYCVLSGMVGMTLWINGLSIRQKITILLTALVLSMVSVVWMTTVR